MSLDHALDAATLALNGGRFPCYCPDDWRQPKPTYCPLHGSDKVRKDWLIEHRPRTNKVIKAYMDELERRDV